MNLEQLKKNIGSRVQLAPPPIYLDEFGRELPSRETIWILSNVTNTDMFLDEAVMGGLTTKRGLDVVHRYDTDRDRSTPGGLQYGFLMLMHQMYIRQFIITWQPCPSSLSD